MSQLQIRRLGYALGAEVRGVDLSQPLDKATVDAIHRAQLEHLALCFPDQVLTKPQFVTFSSYFGEVDDNPYSKTRDLESTQIILLSNKETQGRPWDGYKEGLSWHSDRSFSLNPTTLTIVNAKELPSVGGDTLFASQFMGYDSLSPKMKEIIEDLYLVHDVTKTAEAKSQRQLAPDQQAKSAASYPPVVHPVVRVHPDSGRKALYAGERVHRFVGMTEEESRPLIDVLNAHLLRYEHQYRHRWRVNDLVVWDNRAVLHRAPWDYDRSEARHMWRCSLRGPETGRRLDAVEGQQLVAV